MKIISVLILLVAGFSVGCGSTGSQGSGSAESYEHPTVTATKSFLQFHQSRNQQVVREVKAAGDKQDFSKSAAILSARAAELRAALDIEIPAGIRSGRFHKDDFPLLTGPLEEELAWAEASAAVLR